MIEGPVVQPFSLAFSGLSPVPDVLEVFDGDSGTGAFGLQNTLFGNGVIHLADLATHYKSWLTRISGNSGTTFWDNALNTHYILWIPWREALGNALDSNNSTPQSPTIY